MTPEERQQVMKDLRAGADLIEKNGWIQGDFYQEREGVEPIDCPVCSVGGLHAVITGSPTPGRGDWAAIQRYIGAKLALWEYLPTDIIAWNDTPGRTAEEVTAAFRDCANALESYEEAPA
jgi:hypothetical protein